MVDKQRILIVDDDANIAELISLYLMKECYETKIVGDGESALREFPSFKPNLVLLDLMLPGIDGYQVCRELRTVSQVPIKGRPAPLPGRFLRRLLCAEAAGRVCGISGSRRKPDQLFRAL